MTTPATNAADKARADLRSWAKGIYALTAAVELLLAAFDGRFAQPGYPWIEWDADRCRYWLNAAAIGHNYHLSGGERRLLEVVASLAGDEILVDLGDITSGLSRNNLALVLAAIAHAGGSHEQSDIVVDQETKKCTTVQLGSLYPWPTA